MEKNEVDMQAFINHANQLGLKLVIKGDQMILEAIEGPTGDLFGGQSQAKQIWNPSPEMLEVASWFGRRPKTVWSKSEMKAWKSIISWFEFDGDDWDALRWYYTKSGCRFLRRDIGTLLNNWQSEIDRAKNYDSEQEKRR